MMLSKEEVKIICNVISPQFGDIVGLYDYTKYPASNYLKFKRAFANLEDPNVEIEHALKWKWGHWGKKNYPQSHKDIVYLVENDWSNFVISNSAKNAYETFNYWTRVLNSSTCYITAAYITHLVHHETTPIIDQHNFRAMNYFLSIVRRNHQANKKPSTWNHIIDLASFIDDISAYLKISKSDLDKFLMMYGKNNVSR